MSKTFKIILVLSGLLLIGLICLAVGMYSMEIEDMNQQTAYKLSRPPSTNE